MAAYSAPASSSPAPAAATPQSAMMFDADANVRWGPVPLGTAARIETLAVDWAGSSLLVLDGTDLFGAGTVAGLWLSSTGAVDPDVRAGERPGAELQLFPLISGGFALAAVRSHRATEAVTSDWVALLPSGEGRVEPVPS